MIWIILSPQPFIFYTTRNSSIQMCNHFIKTGFTNLNVFETLGFYILCNASLSSVMSLPIYMCLLPFLMTNFKEPLLLAFFLCGWNTKIYHYLHEYHWNYALKFWWRNSRKGFKIWNRLKNISRWCTEQNCVKKHNIATHWMKTRSSQNKVQEQLRDATK